MSLVSSVRRSVRASAAMLVILGVFVVITAALLATGSRRVAAASTADSFPVPSTCACDAGICPVPSPTLTEIRQAGLPATAPRRLGPGAETVAAADEFETVAQVTINMSNFVQPTEFTIGVPGTPNPPSVENPVCPRDLRATIGYQTRPRAVMYIELPDPIDLSKCTVEAKVYLAGGQVENYKVPDPGNKLQVSGNQVLLYRDAARVEFIIRCLK